MGQPWDILPRLDQNAFKGQELQRDGLWAVCFGADWCPYCRAFLVKLASIKEQAEGEGFKMAMGDLEDYDDPIWDTFNIDIVPTLIAFKGGKAIWRRDGGPGVGLEENDLQALCHALTGAPCPSEAKEAGLRFGSHRPQPG